MLEKWRPERLAVIDVKTLAITADTTLSFIQLDESLLHGQLIKIVGNFESPRELCFHPRKSNSIMVTDGNIIKHPFKKNTVVVQGFQTAFDLAAVNVQLGSYQKRNTTREQNLTALHSKMG